MSEIDVVLGALGAAKQSNIASIRAIEAVERMLAPVEEYQPEVTPEVEPEPEGCQHTNAIEVHSMTQAYKVCECGEQINL